MTTGPLPEPPGLRARPYGLPIEAGGSVHEDRFRSLFEEAPIPYHEIDSEGIIRRVNGAECRMLGYEASELIGHPVWDFVIPSEAQTARDTIRRKLAGSHPIAPFERSFVARDGSVRVLEKIGRASCRERV